MNQSEYYLDFEQEKMFFGKKQLMDFVENPYSFFKYLKNKKKGYGTDLLCETKETSLFTIKSTSFYELFAYKIYLCELVYNAINLVQ